MQKTLLLCFLMISVASVKGQTAIEKANKCYDEKNYQCAINFYSEAVANKGYQDKDYAEIQYRIAYGYYSLEKYNDAITYFQKVIERDVAFRAAWWNLASSYYKVENFQKAAEAYTKAAGLYTDAKSLRSIQYWKGKSFFSQKKYKEALEALKEAFTTDPLYDDAWAVAGDVCYNLYNYREAIAYYQKAIETAPAESKKIIGARHYWKGRAYFNLYKFDSAMIDYQQVLVHNPDHKDVVWEIAAVYYNQKRWQEAVAQYSKTIGLFSNDTASLKNLYYVRGYCYKQLKDQPKALADMNEALKINPAYLSALQVKAEILLQQKKYKEAIPVYTAAIESDQYKYSSPLFYAMRAKCSLALKDTINALSDLAQAEYYDEEAEYGEIYVEKGNINFGKKKYTEAASAYGLALSEFDYYDNNENMSVLWFRKGLSNLLTGSAYVASSALEKSIFYDSLNKEAHRYLGEAFFTQKNFVQAEKSFANCIRLYAGQKDSLPKMYSYRGMARSQQKNYIMALADYEQAEKLKPAVVDYPLGVGQLAFELKDYKKAVTAFSKVIPLYKPIQKNEIAFAYYARGRAYHELKDKQKALQDFNKAIEVVPTYAEAKTWLSTVTNASY